MQDRIPDDVWELARKAGVDHIDWYAGRIEPAPAPILAERRAELERVAALARQQHRERRLKSLKLGWLIRS